MAGCTNRAVSSAVHAATNCSAAESCRCGRCCTRCTPLLPLAHAWVLTKALLAALAHGCQAGVEGHPGKASSSVALKLAGQLQAGAGDWQAGAVSCSMAAEGSTAAQHTHTALHYKGQRCMPHNTRAGCARLPGGWVGQACRQRTPVMLNPGVPSSGVSGVSSGVSMTAQQPGQGLAAAAGAAAGQSSSVRCGTCTEWGRSFCSAGSRGAGRAGSGASPMPPPLQNRVNQSLHGGKHARRGGR